MSTAWSSVSRHAWCRKHTSARCRAIAKRHANREGAGQEDSADFKAGKKAIKQRTSLKTEVVYCERVWQLLQPGGQAAIVLPDGLLTNASLQGVRDWILERFKVLAVLSLPQFAFAHFGAGVKSSVIFAEKRWPNASAADDEAIFMAIAAKYRVRRNRTHNLSRRGGGGNHRGERTERQSCDLFDWEVTFDWVLGEGGKPSHWSERRRQVIPGSGLLGQYAAFKRDPEPFFA